MRRVIKLKESDLEVIIKTLLEQNSQQRYVMEPPRVNSDYLGKGGQFERSLPSAKPMVGWIDYKCLPSGGVKGFANYVNNNKQKLMTNLGVDKNLLSLMAKAAMGIIGRETTFGAGTEFKDDAAEFLTQVGLGFIPQGLQSGYNTVLSLAGKDPQQMSLGAAQFTRDTWNRYGLDKKIGPYDDNFGTVSQGLGALYRINDDYKSALKTGNGTGPSVNPIAVRQGKIKQILGTGNNALDLSIVSHNMAGMIKKWCETSDPNYAGPCDQKVYLPFPDTKKDFKVTVYQDKPITNYFPNKKSGNLTSIGYLEEVTKYINQFNCFSL